MRQDDTARGTGWGTTGAGGVGTNRPVILPDPATRFARTAARLTILAKGHPMAAWLDFLARLSAAQDRAAAAPAPAFGAEELERLARASQAGLPPLSADGLRLAPAWRDRLRLTLAAFADPAGLPPAVTAAVEELGQAGAPAQDALAEAFLAGGVDADNAGPAVFVAAALQVHFTCLAARLDEGKLALLPERSLCPVCGSPPAAGVVTASGPTPGLRYLHCQLCSTAWNHVRAVCIVCGKSEHLSLRTIDGQTDAVRAETCDDCGSYAKMLYQAKDPALDPYADDLASLGLDLMVGESGWIRHAPNPFLLAS